MTDRVFVPHFISLICLSFKKNRETVRPDLVWVLVFHQAGIFLPPSPLPSTHPLPSTQQQFDLFNQLKLVIIKFSDNINACQDLVNITTVLFSHNYYRGKMSWPEQGNLLWFCSLFWPWPCAEHSMLWDVPENPTQQKSSFNRNYTFSWTFCGISVLAFEVSLC